MQITEGAVFKEAFSFSQEEVKKFASVSGDYNPLHLDATYAASTIFKQPIIHGFLGASVFSKILGTKFPGEGTVYLKQSMEFKRPMFVDVQYEAVLTILQTDTEKHTAEIETKILDKETGKLIVAGSASVLNKEKII